MTPHDLTEFYIRTQRHGNTTACIQAANASGAVVLVPTELEARRVRELGARAFSLSRGARELVGSSDAFVVDPTVLAVAGAKWSVQVSGLEVERDEATRALADARADVARLKAENDRLIAELAEARATLLNERGEGDPPVKGWRWVPESPDASFWEGGDWVNARRGLKVWRAHNGPGWVWGRRDPDGSWRGPPNQPDDAPARAAMRTASAP